MYTLRVLLVWRCFFNHFEALKVHKFCDMSGDKHRLMICFSQSAAFDKNSSNPIWINLESKKTSHPFCIQIVEHVVFVPWKNPQRGSSSPQGTFWREESAWHMPLLFFFCYCCVSEAPSAAITSRVISLMSKQRDLWPLADGHPPALTFFTCFFTRKVIACHTVCICLRVVIV